MDNKETILGYDVEALKRDIKRRKAEIKILTDLIKRGAKQKEAFSAEIREAKKNIALLKSYIKLIEENKDGN